MIRPSTEHAVKTVHDAPGSGSHPFSRNGDGAGGGRLSFSSPRFDRQSGISLIGLILALIIVGFFAVMGFKIVPSVIEYRGIVKAVNQAKQSGTTVLEIQRAYDRQAEVGYLEAIRGYDLEIVKVDNEFTVSFAYEKKIPLMGPASLLLEFSGSTAQNAQPASARAASK